MDTDRAVDQARVGAVLTVRRGLALPGSAAPTASGLGEGGVEEDGDQPAGALLHPDGSRPKATGYRSLGVSEDDWAIGRVLEETQETIWMPCSVSEEDCGSGAAGKLDQDLQEEMAFHREQAAKEFEASGISPETAHYAAMRQLAMPRCSRNAATR